jgi:2-polyprenyl-3-methyl-5-hydroxy-6-metoxy-1,4-benzoquinol methylase
MQTPILPDIVGAYSSAGLLPRFMIRYRPSICPPGPVYAHIRKGASVLDVGCGMGLHLITLSAMERIGAGCGVDVSSRAIEQAKTAAGYYPKTNLQFSVISSVDEIPMQLFDVVMMIDVMHHIPAELREATFSACVRRLKPGGTFIYKDMADAPKLHALANRAHDLIVARELIEYLPLEIALKWADLAKLQLVERSEYRRLVYAHELLVFKKAQ